MRRWGYGILAALLGVLLATTAHATSYYVDGTASDCNLVDSGASVGLDTTNKQQGTGAAEFVP